jgi:hypothetical protein
MGKMPDALQAAAAGGDVLVASEGLPVRNDVRALKIPGAKASNGVRTASGAIVLLPGRILASIGKYVILDTDFTDRDGTQRLTISRDGVLITFDVSSVLSDGVGSVEVRYRMPLDESILSHLPATECSVALSNAAAALLNPWRGNYSGGNRGGS